jgi:hypothetical protein
MRHNEKERERMRHNEKERKSKKKGRDRGKEKKLDTCKARVAQLVNDKSNKELKLSNY